MSIQYIGNQNRVRRWQMYNCGGSISFPDNYYFVTKTGNDITGDGSYSNPWLTVNKGITSISAGDVLNIGNGTYQEDNGSGYYSIDANFASETIVQSLSGNADDVIIQGASSANFNVWLGLNSLCQNITFKNITIKSRVNTNLYALRLVNTNNIKFDNVTHTVLSSAAGVRSAVNLGVTSVQNTTFLECTINQSGTDIASGIDMVECANVNITDCTFLMVGSSIITTGNNTRTVSNITINGGIIENTGARITVLLGADDVAGTGPAVTGSISDITIKHSTSLAGHNLLIGAGCSNFVVDGVVANQTYDHAIVIKECSGAEVKNCTSTAGNAAFSDAIAFKAAVSANAHNNTFYTPNAYGFRLYVGDTGNKCQNWQFQNNEIITSGTGLALNIGDDTDDLGGGVCDYNIYHNNSGLGIVRSDLDVQSLLELQTAWADYDVTTNDAHSSVV